MTQFHAFTLLMILLISIPTTYSQSNTHRPDFTQNEYAQTVSEDNPINAVLLTVEATDPDNHAITYGIEGDVHDYFELGVTSGDLILRNPLDREVASSLDFNVIAVDQGLSPQTSTARVVIIVDDVNDNKPEFTTFPSISINEDLTPVSFLDIFVATDADSGTNAQVRYSISGDPDGTFSISHLNGSLYLEKTVDYEVNRQINIVIVATDEGSPALFRDKGLTITINNVDDTPPAFLNLPYTISILENTSVGAMFLTVEAMDQDEGGTNTFNYTMQSATGDGASRFSIGITSGNISVDMALDFETIPSYEVVIHAQEITSVNSGQQTVTTTVTITIIDVNDEPPDLPPTVVGEASESIEIGHSVLQLTYTDPDTVVNDYVFTVLTSGAKFNVSNTGDITINSNLDYETDKTEVFTVQMCEAINSALCDTTSVSVTVTDENDNSPVFTQAGFTASITEEMMNANILTITAMDADDGVFGMVSYSITGTLAGRFFVDANGQIDNTVPIDRETDPIVVLTYTAADLDPNFSRQTSVPLTITVDDINDQTPVFLSIPSPCAFDISESVNVDVFTFSVSDGDQAATVNALTLVTVNNADFAVSGTHPSFTLMTNGILDREMIPSYTLLLTATDQGTSPLSSDITCTVTVTDVNDQTPSFSGSPYLVTLKENRAVQTAVVTVSATDNDIGANARLTYEIELGNGEGLFFIDSSTGAISLQNSLDHETTTSYSLEVIAIDSAVSPLTGTGTVSITVTDVNDNIPVFGQIRYTMTITEGSAITTVVGTITATDGDSTSPNNDITFSIQAGNTGGTFELTTSGEIRVLVPPIFDTTPSYTLTLVVIDMGTDPQSLSSTTTVVITVIDTNNNDPVLTNTPYSFTVTEGTHADTPVGLVSASDVDSDTVTNFNFSLVLTPSTLPFNIDISSGLIATTTNTIDRETTPLFTFTVIVEDNTVSPRRDSETVTVQVVDVNDNHPVFMSTPYSGTIDENSLVNIPVGVTVIATDGDIGTNAAITYFIIGGDKNTHFKIDSSTGVISTTANPIDFEVIGTPVVLTIEARDGGIPSRATDITVSIAITDVNDNPPTFLGTPYSTTVAEDITIGTTVFTAIINDADTTAITLTITGGNIGVVFRTDGMDVILKLALDRETLDSYTLDIEADDGIAMITTTLTITVSDVNDNDPVVAASNPASFSFPEDRSPGVITTISVTDEDIGVNDDIYYELTDTFGIFSISQRGGVLSQIAPFDFDTTETYMLEIIVRDGGIVSRSATHSINITIIDLNDNTPTFTSDLYREAIDESQTVPYTFISNTMATDGDTNVADNGLISHSIVSVSPDFRSSFEINEQTGRLTLLDSLDYEVVQEIVLNIMAIDNAVSVGDRLSSTTDVILTINDVNDNTPTFLSSIYRITIFENSNVPSTVGVLTARDIDSGANGAITYSNSGMPSNFGYSSTTGVLTLNTNFDRDTLSPNPFTFMVIATDGGSSPRQNSSTVIVEILDQNDNAPMFSMASYSFSISEGTTFPVTVGTVVATETNDQGANAEIEYAITHGGEGNFVIDAMTGVITTISGVDRETEDTFELTVVAYDLGTNPLSTYVAVTITLDDINDNPPVFSFPTYHLNVTEGAANMNAFSSVDIIATDPDMGTNGEVTYSIPDSPNNFIAVQMGLLATVQSVAALDFESTPHYQIEILAIDKATTGKMTGTATLFITLIDVNDNPPIIMPLPTQTFSEATSGGSFLFQVIATDADSGINAEIQYSITAGNIGTKFSIQEDSGVVTTTTSPLDFETLTSYTLTVTATDRGTSPMSDTLMVQIGITDSNDNAPMFGSDPFTFTAPENDASRTFMVPATDDDSSSDFNQIFYSIRSGNESGIFLINDMTGEISLSESLDRERPGLEILLSGNGIHRLIVQAQDKNRTEFTGTTHVQISVTDLNDNHPSINRECPISLIVQENVTVEEELLTTIPVTDADFGAAGEFTYVIASGNPMPRVFRVNQTGTLEVFGTKLDREIQQFYLLQLELRDMGSPPLTSTCMINVTVLDSNTHDPIFANEPNMIIPEDTAINTLLLTYTATDEDIGLNGDIIYTINSGNFGTEFKFKLGQFDGKLTVIGTLDFETLDSYTLDILAIDRGTPPRNGTGVITINITDVNDNAPVLVENITISIREDISNGVPIYTAIATDADSDANQMIEYRILDGNGGMIFALDLNTGELTINDNTPINREVRDEYVLTISARDKGTPPLEGILNLTITVTDFNDGTPFFLNQNLAFAIIEDTVENNYTGQIIITLTGNDSDIGLNGEFTFRIDNGNRGGSFSLSSDGVLTRLLSIDRETFDDFNLTITIVDKGTPQLSSSMFVYIDITDTNDNTPIFSNMTYTFSTFENAVLTTVIGNVGATDQDEGTNRMIVYVIPNNTIPFSVDPSTGMLSVSSILDRETQDVYSFDIEGYDGGIHPRTGTTTVNVNILDVNDNQPYFIAKSYDFTIPENYPITDTFDFVVGTDSDIAPNNVLYYHVLDGSNHTMVGLNSGLLSVVRNLDRESADSVVTGSILVTNTASLPNPSVYNYTFSRTEISITLTDRNDNPPIFTKPWYRRGVISTTEYESVIEQVFANDADLVNSTYFGGEIRFTPDPSRVNTNRFRLDGTNGNIHVFRDLVPDVGLYFDLHVIASDNRLLTPHFNATTRVTLWVITADLQIVITIQQTKPEVEMNINGITEILENITQSFINIDQVVYNSANNEHTDIYFHAVDKGSLGIVSRDSVIRVVDENRITVGSLLKDISVSEVKPATSPVILLDPVLLTISIVLAFLVVICCCLLILCIIYDQVRRKQLKHRQRVSLLKSYDASLDYNYSLSGQTYENPMWLHPYEQWEKEDEFTKGNPLFYESQEFIMDMFRESDDEKSEETVSFGSWGASQAKMRARAGISGMSKASTLTRMSDVDQDYNVELLAEVLGDDLPPSGDEPSEISNI